MKIALVAQHATPALCATAHQAAGDLRIRELGQSLAAKGHHVTLYAHRPDPGLSRDAALSSGTEPSGGSEPTAGFRTEYIGQAATRDDAELLARVPEFAAQLRERWERDRPDVVHAFRWTSGLAALAAARDLGLPVVQSFGSLGIAERRHHLIPDSAAARRVRLESAIGRGVSAAIAANSQEQADLARMGVSRRSITVIPCGIDTDEFTPEGPTARRGDRPRLVSVTDLDSYDELANLLRALSRVPGAELVVAGGPPHAELAEDPAHRKLASLATALGVADRVMFAGQVDRGALPALLRSADVLVSTAEYDPAGTVVLEAMACGTPVVATPVGGQLDAVVDGTTGVLAEPGRPGSLAQRIRRLLGHPMLLEAFSVAAADRVRSRYSRDRIADEILAVYDGIRDIAPLAA